MIEKLAQLEHTYEELTAKLADPEVLADPKVYTRTSKALADISHVVELYREYREVERQLGDIEEMLAGMGKGDELYEMTLEEQGRLTGRAGDLEEELRRELTPQDPNDERNVVLEIRAGTGGDEATLFAAELFRMYSRHAEEHTRHPKFASHR